MSIIMGKGCMGTIYGPMGWKGLQLSGLQLSEILDLPLNVLQLPAPPSPFQEPVSAPINTCLNST